MLSEHGCLIFQCSVYGLLTSCVTKICKIGGKDDHDDDDDDATVLKPSHSLATHFRVSFSSEEDTDTLILMMRILCNLIPRQNT